METDTTATPYDARGAASAQWWPSRYGSDDTLGSLNEIQPERTLSALQVPREGRVLQLAVVLNDRSPGYQQRFFKQTVLTHEVVQPICAGGTELTCMEETVAQTYQIGTHLDTLGHVGIAGAFYNGHKFEDFYTPIGLKLFGPSSLQPWVSRGVCLDIAALKGVGCLEPDYCITVEDLEAACARQDVEVRAGDAVLIHTGWGRHWNTDNASYTATEPGPGWEASHWLTDRRVSMVGADNWGFEVFPSESSNKVFQCHQHLLAETGTYIVENVRTDELAAGGYSEFLFVMAPIRTEGSTGSMVAPIAVV